jgi:ribonucleoside-diphosphate reductase alpha chain
MKILSKQGKRLSNLDVHDIICKIGEIVVMGGVRRTAMISLSDLDDEELRDAKKGQFYIEHPQRAMANNSAVYLEKPSSEQFLEEWLALLKSGSGERGIFNRGGLKAQLPERRWKNFEKHWQTAGTNPCGEIILRSKEFCNLTEVVARPEDTEETLLKKIEIATILGTYQATLTYFPYLSKEWKRNCEEERLLGVSITGQWDCKVVRNKSTLRKMKERALEVNKVYARRFGIAPSLAITCVKPSGTVSLLVDSSSGMHPRHSPYYIRRVRISATDALFQMLRDQKFPFIHPEVGQSEDKATTFVLEFPVAAPKNAVFRDDLTAIDQLEHWKMVKENYTEHNPSVTVTIDEDEWIRSANWLYDNWDILGGLSFLPKQKHVYQLAPLEEITEERYKEMIAQIPEIDFSQILVYEKDDETEGAKEFACVGGICEVDPEEGRIKEIKPLGASISD